MSTTITLYQGCRLSNKYEEVFNGRQTLDDYLATLTSKVVYSSTEDDLYFTNNGSISIDNETNDIIGLVRHGDKYNYLKFERSQDGTRYAFVDSITLVDRICVINYTEDIWNNYALMSNAISFQMKNSIIGQAKGLTSSSEYTSLQLASIPKQLPISYEALKNPSFYFSPEELELEDGKELYCYIMVTASAYKSVQQGEYSQRFINNYLLSYQNKPTSFEGGTETPLNVLENDVWPINNDTLNIINDLVTLASTTSIDYQGVNGFKYEILDVKIIPRTIGQYFFEPVLSGDSTHTSGIGTDFTIVVKKYDYSNNYIVYPFDSDIRFKNLCVQQYSMFRSGSIDKWTNNGYNPTSTIECPKTIRFTASDKITGLGNYSRFIPLEWNGQDIEYYLQLNLNVNGNSITLKVDNQLYDVSEDFRYSVPFEIQTAEVSQQQRMARYIGTMNNLMGIITTASGFVAGAGATQHNINSVNGQTADVNGVMSSALLSTTHSAISSMYGMIGKVANNRQLNQRSFTTNKAIHTEDITCKNVEIGGFREYICNPDNDLYVQAFINKYGYLYKILINDISIFTSADYVRFEIANVYGSFSQSIARDIESILRNGIILLHA